MEKKDKEGKKLAPEVPSASLSGVGAPPERHLATQEQCRATQKPSHNAQDQLGLDSHATLDS